MFTRKHFETIAEIIRTEKEEETRKRLFEAFSTEFEKSNSNFKPELFKQACGIS